MPPLEILSHEVLAVTPRMVPALVSDARAIDGRWSSPAVEAAAGGDRESQPYRTAGRMALINLSGVMQKHRSRYAMLFGGASTSDLRDAVLQATEDGQVDSILIRVDSPGGSVAGTGDLADAVRAAAAVKPVHAFIEDLGASAAYWVASQATRVLANPTAMVGSIGTYAVIYDFSKAADEMGIGVHVVRAGEFKGAGVPGTKISKEQLAEFQREINDLNEHFVAGVARGRDLPMERARKLANGAVHIGAKAIDLGLIDDVATWNAAITQLRHAVPRGGGARSTVTPRKDRKETPSMKFNKHQIAMMVAWGMAEDADAAAQKTFYQALDDDKRQLVDDLATAQAAAGGQRNGATPAPGSAPAHRGGDRGDRDEPGPGAANGGVGGTATATATADDEAVQSIVRQTLQSESKRRRTINATLDHWKARGYEIDDLRAELLDDVTCDLHQANGKILEFIQEHAPSGAGGHISVGATQREKFSALASEALLMAAGIEDCEFVYDPATQRIRKDPEEAKKQRQLAEKEGLRGLTLQGLARKCLHMAGDRRALDYNGDELFDAVAVGGFNMTTSDFPIILESIVHKTLAQAYELAETTFQLWAGEGTAKDYRTHKKVRLSESPLLKKRPENFPAEHAYFNEIQESFDVEDNAIAVGLTRKMMVNDDLGAFTDIGTMIGSGAKLTIEHELWANVIALNSYAGPTMSDGTALFHSSRGNLAGSGAAPSQTTLTEGIVGLAKQTGFGKDGSKIGLANVPKFVLGGMTASMEAEKIINAQYAADDQRQSPQFQKIRQLQSIDVPYLTINERDDWYLMPPRNRAAIQVTYLNGQKTPMIKRVEGTLIAGFVWVVSQDFGVDAVEWRNAWRNPGS